MVRAGFNRSLNQLQEDLLSLGDLVERAIIKSMEALEERDLTASFEVVQDDELINEKRFKLEEDSIDLIATQQPLAIDLRTLIGFAYRCGTGTDGRLCRRHRQD